MSLVLWWLGAGLFFGIPLLIVYQQLVAKPARAREIAAFAQQNGFSYEPGTKMSLDDDFVRLAYFKGHNPINEGFSNIVRGTIRTGDFLVADYAYQALTKKGKSYCRIGAVRVSGGALPELSLDPRDPASAPLSLLPFLQRESNRLHIQAGGLSVLISAPEWSGTDLRPFLEDLRQVSELVMALRESPRQ